MEDLSAPTSGLRDAHLHLAEYGESLTLVPLAECRSVDEVLQSMARAAANVPSERWVRGAGMRIEALAERRAPTAKELHEAGGGRCVMARSFDHHAMAVSTRVLELAGIGAATPDPKGGVIVRSGSERGEPTGLLLESACDLVWRIVPAAGDEEYRGWVVAALVDLTRRGFVEVHDLLSRERLVRVLHTLEREGALPMHVRLYATPEHFDAVRGACGSCPSERVRFGGLKLFADGTLNSRTAAMLTAFRDPIAGSECGKALLSMDEFAAGLMRARAVGAGLAVHAIGDAAVRTVLDAVESCGGAGAKSRSRVPGLDAVRIEHAQFIDEADVQRFPALGVVCSPQPCHLLTDIEAVHRLMPHRAHRAFPWRDVVEAYERAGLDPVDWVWLGSDAPIVPPFPEDNVRAAVLRAREVGGQSVAPEQALTAERVRSLLLSRARTLGA